MSPRLILLALWNLRLLGLFLVGPVAGVMIGGWTFAVPVPLRWAALGMLGLSLALLAVLVRDEVGRLARRVDSR